MALSKVTAAVVAFAVVANGAAPVAYTAPARVVSVTPLPASAVAAMQNAVPLARPAVAMHHTAFVGTTASQGDKDMWGPDTDAIDQKEVNPVESASSTSMLGDEELATEAVRLMPGGVLSSPGQMQHFADDVLGANTMSQSASLDDDSVGGAKHKATTIENRPEPTSASTMGDPFEARFSGYPVKATGTWNGFSGLQSAAKPANTKPPSFLQVLGDAPNGS
uniref:Uncharacterized protein n=1 Tax=Chromera velia CCMP2878 TaxID=1169474 RepID=A0A0G4HI10_9ALVE|eukprot:Cvel_6931.t1-p1 / transcript=Cvel_6931.t1 / gene=Cvel_6931 / organism=Chromera_velia_CCMP2878 / gene_product=hypothetical protein / transcript_product=hypothetical protein / location=Cvel_scaffold351:12656-15218(+) / protein_length=220 / sequence_SO=supercontig / SO=protein_coding / is_pseudo=false